MATASGGILVTPHKPISSNQVWQSELTKPVGKLHPESTMIYITPIVEQCPCLVHAYICPTGEGLDIACSSSRYKGYLL